MMILMNENDYIDIILDIILHIAVTNMTAAAGSACTFTKSVQNKVQVVLEACQSRASDSSPSPWILTKWQWS